MPEPSRDALARALPVVLSGLLTAHSCEGRADLEALAAAQLVPSSSLKLVAIGNHRAKEATSTGNGQEPASRSGVQCEGSGSGGASFDLLLLRPQREQPVTFLEGAALEGAAAH